MRHHRAHPAGHVHELRRFEGQVAPARWVEAPAPNSQATTPLERRPRLIVFTSHTRHPLGITVVLTSNIERLRMSNRTHPSGVFPAIPSRTSLKRAAKLILPAVLCLSATVGMAAQASASVAPHSGKYVALGSSFAAGGGTNDPSEVIDLGCGRLSTNYAHRVAVALGMDLTDVTCGGATIDNIVGTPQVTPSDNVTRPPQIDAVTADTSLVTITAGGNDVRLISSLWYYACQADPCRCGQHRRYSWPVETHHQGRPLRRSCRRGRHRHCASGRETSDDRSDQEGQGASTQRPSHCRRLRHHSAPVGQLVRRCSPDEGPAQVHQRYRHGTPTCDQSGRQRGRCRARRIFEGQRPPRCLLRRSLGQRVGIRACTLRWNIGLPPDVRRHASSCRPRCSTVSQRSPVSSVVHSKGLRGGQASCCPPRVAGDVGTVLATSWRSRRPPGLLCSPHILRTVRSFTAWCGRTLRMAGTIRGAFQEHKSCISLSGTGRPARAESRKLDMPIHDSGGSARVADFAVNSWRRVWPGAGTEPATDHGIWGCHGLLPAFFRLTRVRLSGAVASRKSSYSGLSGVRRRPGPSSK